MFAAGGSSAKTPPPRTPSAAPSPLLSGLRSLSINAKATTPMRLGLGSRSGFGTPGAFGGGAGGGASAWAEGAQLDEGERVDAQALLDGIEEMVASLQTKIKALEKN